MTYNQIEVSQSPVDKIFRAWQLKLWSDVGKSDCKSEEGTYRNPYIWVCVATGKTLDQLRKNVGELSY